MQGELLLSALRLLLALPVVILLAYISLRLSGKYLYRQSHGNGIQVIERVPLHHKSMLCVVRIFDEYMVIGVSEDRIQPIKTLTPEEAEAYLTQKDQKGYMEEWSKSIIQWTKGKKHE